MRSRLMRQTQMAPLARLPRLPKRLLLRLTAQMPGGVDVTTISPRLAATTHTTPPKLSGRSVVTVEGAIQRQIVEKRLLIRLIPPTTEESFCMLQWVYSLYDCKTGRLCFGYYKSRCYKISYYFLITIQLWPHFLYTVNTNHFVHDYLIYQNQTYLKQISVLPNSFQIYTHWARRTIAYEMFTLMPVQNLKQVFVLGHAPVILYLFIRHLLRKEKRTY